MMAKLASLLLPFFLALCGAEAMSLITGMPDTGGSSLFSKFIMSPPKMSSFAKAFAEGFKSPSTLSLLDDQERKETISNLNTRHPFSTIRLNPVATSPGVSKDPTPDQPALEGNERQARLASLFASRKFSMDGPSSFEKPIEENTLPDVKSPIVMDLAKDEQDRVAFAKKEGQLPPHRSVTGTAFNARPKLDTSGFKRPSLFSTSNKMGGDFARRSSLPPMPSFSSPASSGRINPTLPGSEGQPNHFAVAPMDDPAPSATVAGTTTVASTEQNLPSGDSSSPASDGGSGQPSEASPSEEETLSIPAGDSGLPVYPIEGNAGVSSSPSSSGSSDPNAVQEQPWHNNEPNSQDLPHENVENQAQPPNNDVEAENPSGESAVPDHGENTVPIEIWNNEAASDSITSDSSTSISTSSASAAEDKEAYDAVKKAVDSLKDLSSSGGLLDNDFPQVDFSQPADTRPSIPLDESLFGPLEVSPNGPSETLEGPLGEVLLNQGDGPESSNGENNAADSPASTDPENPVVQPSSSVTAPEGASNTPSGPSYTSLDPTGDAPPAPAGSNDPSGDEPFEVLDITSLLEPGGGAEEKYYSGDSPDTAYPSSEHTSSTSSDEPSQPSSPASDSQPLEDALPLETTNTQPDGENLQTSSKGDSNPEQPTNNGQPSNNNPLEKEVVPPPKDVTTTGYDEPEAPGPYSPTNEESASSTSPNEGSETSSSENDAGNGLNPSGDTGSDQSTGEKEKPKSEESSPSKSSPFQMMFGKSLEQAYKDSFGSLLSLPNSEQKSLFHSDLNSLIDQRPSLSLFSKPRR